MYKDSVLKRYYINRKKDKVKHLHGCCLPELLDTLNEISKEYNVSVNDIYIDTDYDASGMELSFACDKTDEEIKAEIDEIKSFREENRQEELQELERLKKKYKQ